MKNYEEMSDFEINKAVALIVGVTFNDDGDPVRFVECDTGAYADFNEIEFDPCNKPEDAWPIITENKISIMFDSTDTRYEGEYHEWCDAISSCQKFGIQYQSNPLRAAMIVFLKMNEGKL